VQRHAKGQIGDSTLRKENAGGCPSKATDQDRRAIVRAVNTLRRTEGANFTSGRIKVIAGVTRLSNRTLNRILNQGGYRYLQGRRKGLLTLADLKKRLKFCKAIRRRKLGLDF
uniref:Transposase Tc1-like domain-containing protein n=1 Tax=Clytia hemisphaerica TaxID=252671 RepID=A0A7M5UT04_9CNID